MAYEKTVLDVMRYSTERIYPSHTKPLPIQPKKVNLQPSARVILEEALNDLNDWLSRGNTPSTRNPEGDLAGIFVNKLKTSYRYNGGETLFPRLSLHSIFTSDIKATFDWDKKTYTLKITPATNYGYISTVKDTFMKSMQEALKEVGDPNKCRGHLLKAFSPFYQTIEKIRNM